jgi:hypothetical protein
MGLLLPLALVAFLYASVGHAGASGYIAVMALAGVPAATIKPVALLLNLVVSAQGSVQFWQAGHLRWRLFWPLLRDFPRPFWVAGCICPRSGSGACSPWCFWLLPSAFCNNRTMHPRGRSPCPGSCC